MKILLVVVAALVSAASCLSLGQLAGQWHAFKANHGRKYATVAEEARRGRIFRQNAIRIAEHNARFEAGEVSFKMAVNQFSDLEAAEFRQRFASGAKGVNGTHARHPLHDPEAATESRWPYGKGHVDWRWMGWVTKVKDQGTCNSCWAFSTTGAVESAFAQKRGYQVLLSEQSLLDCSATDQYPNSCACGWIDRSYDYAMTRGIDVADGYPYTGAQGACKRDKNGGSVKIKGVVHIRRNSEDDLRDAVYKHGPVSVNVDADPAAFQSYRSGIFYDPACRSDAYTHSVLVVGYGTERDAHGTSTDYWIVKNQWGDSWWGEDGYMRLARNRGNHCAVAAYALYPVL